MKKFLLIFLLSLGVISVQAQKPNTFTGSIHFEITGKEKVNMKIFTKQWLTAATVDVNKTDNIRMIFDLKKENVTILTNSGPTGKMGILSKLENLPEVDAGQENLNVVIEKTNEKKSILGYDCIKYIIKTDEGTAECWITDKVHFNPFESFGRLGNQPKKIANEDVFKEIDGLALETKYVDNNNQTTYIKVTSLDNKQPDESIFSTEGYEIMDISGFPGMMNMGK